MLVRTVMLSAMGPVIGWLFCCSFNPSSFSGTKQVAVHKGVMRWAAWSRFSGNSATGTISNGGEPVRVTMRSNFVFDGAPQIYGYAKFRSYRSGVPNTRVPRVTWAKGAGGTTEMCFSRKVTNPVLLIASLGGIESDVTAPLTFSIPYVVVFDGGGMVYNNSRKLTGREGYAVIMFPGEFTCVTIKSSMSEYYTNITWGLMMPKYPGKAGIRQ